MTILAGIGIGSLITILLNLNLEPLAILFNQSNNPTLFSFFGLILVGFISLIMIPISKFHVRVFYAFSLVVIYIAFIVMAILTEIDVIFIEAITDKLTG